MSACFDSQPYRLLMFLYVLLKPYIKEECIRVRYVPPASVAIPGAGCLPAGWYLPKGVSAQEGGCLLRGGLVYSTPCEQNHRQV